MKMNLWQILGIEPVIDDRYQMDYQDASKEQPGIATTMVTEGLQRAQRMEMIGTLAGGLAHDLRNILAPIIHAADLLELEGISAGAKQHVSAIRHSAERATELVQQILIFSRGGGTELREIQPEPIIEELAALVRQSFPNNISVRFSVRSRLATIRSEPTQLLQILLNLCVNSRDAMPDGGVLSIVADNQLLDRDSRVLPQGMAPGHYVRISVVDTGTGMPPEVLKRIYEPFFTTKPPGKGTGLGFSVVHGLVKAHNGFTTVSSLVGKGTEVAIYIPAVKIHSTIDVPLTSPQPRHTDKVKTILLVDDDPGIIALLSMLLMKFGYGVITATSGAEAVRIASDRIEQIDAVVTDIVMPDISGWEAITRIKALDPHKPIIALSGAPKYYRAEFSDDVTFIQKPVSARELLFALEQSIKRPIVSKKII